MADNMKLTSHLETLASTPTVAASDADLETMEKEEKRAAAMREVFSITELLEAILKVTPPLGLFKLQQVSKQFRDNITCSPALQKLRLDAVLKPLESGTHRRNCNCSKNPFSPFFDRVRACHLVIKPFTLPKIVKGGGKRANCDDEVPELHFTLNFRKYDDIGTQPAGGAKQGKHALNAFAARKCDLDEAIIIGYNGERETHDSEQSWSYLEMTTDCKPFDVMVWVFIANGNFYKHKASFGSGRRTMRDLFDVLTEVSNRSMERHENEAQLASWYGRC